MRGLANATARGCCRRCRCRFGFCFCCSVVFLAACDASIRARSSLFGVFGVRRFCSGGCHQHQQQSRTGKSKSSKGQDTDQIATPKDWLQSIRSHSLSHDLSAVFACPQHHCRRCFRSVCDECAPARRFLGTIPEVAAAAAAAAGGAAAGGAATSSPSAASSASSSNDLELVCGPCELHMEQAEVAAIFHARTLPGRTASRRKAAPIALPFFPPAGRVDGRVWRLRARFPSKTDLALCDALLELDCVDHTITITKLNVKQARFAESITDTRTIPIQQVSTATKQRSGCISLGANFLISPRPLCFACADRSCGPGSEIFGPCADDQSSRPRVAAGLGAHWTRARSHFCDPRSDQVRPARIQQSEQARIGRHAGGPLTLIPAVVVIACSLVLLGPTSPLSFIPVCYFVSSALGHTPQSVLNASGVLKWKSMEPLSYYMDSDRASIRFVSNANVKAVLLLEFIVRVRDEVSKIDSSKRALPSMLGVVSCVSRVVACCLFPCLCAGRMRSASVHRRPGCRSPSEHESHG